MNATPGSFATPTRLAIAACAVALLGACTGDAPSGRFVAVPPAGSPAGTRTCPDLTGTFDLAGTALARTIAGRQPPPTHGLPVVLTFKPGPSSIEGWWVVPRERLVAFAREQSEDAPKRYAQWRSLVLKEHLPQQYDYDAYQASVAELGPPGPTYALIVARGCSENWMLVQLSTETKAGDGDKPRLLEHETWLARDADGALLVRYVTYTLATYTIWAPATQSIRTSSSSSVERIAQADPESAAPLVAADLPADPATRPRTLMQCAEVPQHVDAFSQRLKALLPPKAQVTRFVLNPVRQSDAKGQCPYAVVDVEIAGGDAYFLSRTEEWVRAEPNVESIESLRPEGGQSRANTRRFRVVLR
ncbi:MAG TPA: hypothetical protein VM555_03260 [Tahibacter sp.]|nr:hypothetical protein [Tahibacter sp.]